MSARRRSGRFLVVLMVLSLTALKAGQNESSPKRSTRPLSCDAALSALFTPPRPQLGRYEVCTTPEALNNIAQPEWSVEAMAPLDAFGAAGSYDRAALARLYGGRRATVARGWIDQGDRFESITLISPHPDRTITQLLPGTLVIRHVIIR